MKFLQSIIDSLYTGSLELLTDENVKRINDITVLILQDSEDVALAQQVLEISNILYNNTSMDRLPLDDGVYDILLEKFKSENPTYMVGAPSIQFPEVVPTTDYSAEPVRPVEFIDRDEFLYFDELMHPGNYQARPHATVPVTMPEQIVSSSMTKRLINTKHNYDKLMGSLNKVKFVLNSQAEELGVLADSNVKVLERDFFQDHIMRGIYHPDRHLTMVVELKEDGVSVEADVNSKISGARTRGDANEGMAADLTPILKDYTFVNALGLIPDHNIFGMKFEAIMTKPDLKRYNEFRGKDYKNCRTAIIGLLSASEAWTYRDFITLVPLATSHDIDRITELEFMNKYYANSEILRYAVIIGTYKEIIFQVKRFVEEAEYMRQFLPFMYDGVVLSYVDPDIIQKLGRENSMDQWSVAIKFTPLKVQSIVRDVTFTVGQNGTITPMIHYDPVEFYGTTHDMSTGHSYDRFMRLGLRYGDIIDVEYVHDVMPYVTKPDNSHNATNSNQIIEFARHCPSCGETITLSDSGKTALCRNMDCPGRCIMRVVNMMKKLNLKDFAEANLLELGCKSLSEMLNITMDDLEKTSFGPKTRDAFLERMNELKSLPILDYKLIGSLGFTNVARSKWKLIMAQYTLKEVLAMSPDELNSRLVAIKGIGSTIAATLMDEIPAFMDDLVAISNMSNVQNTKGGPKAKKIRFTGVRDSALTELLNLNGADAGEGSVTKDTDYLVVPSASYTSSKVTKAMKDGVMIVPIDLMRSNMHEYL